MNRELLSDLVTEEIEAVMREKAEAMRENHLRPGWKIGAFERAFADRTILREATCRAMNRYDALTAPAVLDQAELFEGENA